MIDTRDCYVDVLVEEMARASVKPYVIRMLERRVARRLGRPTPLPITITMYMEQSPNWGFMRCYPLPRYLPDHAGART